MNDDILDPDVWADLQELPSADVARIIEIYLQSSLSILTAIREAARAGNNAKLRALLHQLKGSSASIGVQELPKLCAVLEQESRAGSLTDLHAAAQRIEAAYGRAAHVLEAERAALLGLRQ